MQITHPPCRTIDVYYYTPCESTLMETNLLHTRVCNEKGVRISDLICALRAAVPTVLTAWIEHVEDLRWALTESH
jgi:hypothetical protein